MSAQAPSDLPTATVDAWFAGHGWQPFAYQRACWQAYLAGESGLVHAPTGMGKTYAVWLGPVLEGLAENAEARSLATTKASRSRGRPPAPLAPPLRVLWITPLRALAADTLDTLRRPILELGLPWTIDARTGDTSQSARRRQKAQLPTALVTTPESLSLLLSYPDARERLATLRAVIVDEWHELLGSKRGVQTELALARLRAWFPSLRVWGLSATLGNLAEACDVLLGAAPRRPDGRLIEGRLPRGFELTTLLPDSIDRFPWAGHMGLRLVPQVLARLDQARSTLLFTNTRSQAERWHQALLAARPEWSKLISLHHGSLDRELRAAAEDGLRTGRLRCVVATSSLDLGVDFSPVDQVLQIGSPKGIARLLQRAGRSGHQPGGVSRLVGVPTNSWELIEFAAARSAAEARAVEPRATLCKPLDVLAQHLVTVACGGGFAADELLAEVRSARAYRGLSAQEWQWVLDFVERGGPCLQAYPDFSRVKCVDGRWQVASDAIARRHRMSIGTIASDQAIQVKFLRGGTLGTLEESFVARLRPGDKFLFAGKPLELFRLRDSIAYVRRARGAVGNAPRWMGGKMPLSSHLARAVLECLASGTDHASPELALAAPLLALQEQWSALPGPERTLLELASTREGSHAFLYPFAGRLVHEGLAPLLAWRLAQCAPATIRTTVNDYGLELLSSAPLPQHADAWRALLSPADLLEHLLACLNANELARRQFREIARVAGLVFPGFPGQPKSARQVQASSGLIFDVFVEYDPQNLLLEQARREVLEQQLEAARMRETLERIAARPLEIVRPPRLTPLSFPLWADRLGAQTTSSERWSDRVRKMVVRLERAADATNRGGAETRRERETTKTQRH